MGGRCGLVVRSQLRDRKVPGDSAEDPPCIGLGGLQLLWTSHHCVGGRHLPAGVVRKFGEGGASSGDADLMKNVNAIGESSVCNLAHKDKVRYPNTTKLSDTVWKETMHRPD
ncbi:hypothetical protein AVEN_49163-1 [Araneus ventricosus]|uniref:Uncharacterized protein n=1 Tax=Araneus ventricosus TaxID=182803 RepID=A0A4Y2C0K6_ARAVE|nr:hypothetical protein AVEN_49163-1 [Araneus ventricosus]